MSYHLSLFHQQATKVPSILERQEQSPIQVDGTAQQCRQQDTAAFLPVKAVQHVPQLDTDQRDMRGARYQSIYLSHQYYAQVDMH